MTRVFICTDTSVLKGLGFKYTGTGWLYRTNRRYRIIIESTGIIRFMNHNKDTYSMFKKMVELGAVEETDITVHYTRTTKNIIEINNYSIKEINNEI